LFPDEIYILEIVIIGFGHRRTSSLSRSRSMMVCSPNMQGKVLAKMAYNDLSTRESVKDSALTNSLDVE